jgi:hypothetical protein
MYKNDGQHNNDDFLYNALKEIILSKVLTTISDDLANSIIARIGIKQVHTSTDYQHHSR